MRTIDANVIVRYIIGDAPEHASKARAVFTAMVEGEVVLECDPVNLAEVFWVLSSFYEVPAREITDELIPILQHSGFRMSEKGRYLHALMLCSEGLVDFTDACACATALEKCDADIIVGTRMHAVGEMPKLRIWTNRTTSRIVSLLAGQEISDSQSGYRLIKVSVLSDVVKSFVTTRYDTESELLIRAARRGYTTAAVAITSIYTGAVSHINPIVDTLRFVRLVSRSMFWR